MKKLFLASFLYSITLCGINVAQIAQRHVEGKIMLNPIAFQRPDLYNSGNIDKGLLFSLLHISDKALNEASKRKIIATQESLDRSFLEMQIPPKMKFLGEPDERERVTQIVNAIIERFNSESLGFSAVVSDTFFNDTPIQQFEDLCVLYDLSELAELESVKSLGGYLSQRSDIESYPNVQSLLALIKKD